MKKILLIAWITVFLLPGCDKDKDTLSSAERPDARLNKVLDEYKELLTGAEWGWKAVLYPGGGSRYSFHFNFSENDRVKMLSDINSTTAVEEYESTYRLRAMQQPSLLFDTYSYLHILSDPDETKSGGDRGQGRYSDFEFRFINAGENTIELTGNYNGSKLILERATQEEALYHMESIAATINAFEKLNSFSTYFKRMKLGNKTYDIAANTVFRTITFNYYEGAVPRSFTSEYYYAGGDIVLLNPFTDGDLTINSLQDVAFNSAANEITVKVNNSSGRIQEATTPVRVNAFAGRSFYTDPPNGSYAVSISGFTAEGKEDAFDLFSIEDYYFLVYWPRFGEVPGNEKPTGEIVDLFGFILYNEAEQRPEIGYGPALKTNITNDGRVVFIQVDEFGETPEQARPMVAATVEQLVIPEGYYVIPTVEGGYDLVSAKDARTWISFF